MGQRSFPSLVCQQTRFLLSGSGGLDSAGGGAQSLPPNLARPHPPAVNLGNNQKLLEESEHSLTLHAASSRNNNSLPLVLRASQAQKAVRNRKRKEKRKPHDETYLFSRKLERVVWCRDCAPERHWPVFLLSPLPLLLLALASGFLFCFLGFLCAKL